MSKLHGRQYMKTAHSVSVTRTPHGWPCNVACMDLAWSLELGQNDPSSPGEMIQLWLSETGERLSRHMCLGNLSRPRVLIGGSIKISEHVDSILEALE